MSLRPGEQLGPYEIVEALGAGGMGEVYRARDRRLDRTIAIKVLHDAEPSTPERWARFQREARAISRLSHPRICQLYDIGNENGRTFLVLEYIDGTTLADRLLDGPLPSREALRHAIQIADGLDGAHRKRIVHSDLKPSNIMLTADGVKLLDFGLARFDEPDGTVSKTRSLLATTEGKVMGTLPYMAPEQIEAGDVDARTDLYALGVVLYKMVGGRRPFVADSKTSLIAAILTSEPPALSELQPTVPETLERVVSRCLAKDPDLRWQTARDLVAELRWIDESGAPRAVRGRPGRRARRGSLIGALAGIAGVGLAAGGALLWQMSRPRTVPAFERITYRAGTVSSARFAPDGETIVYTAAWDGGEYELYAARQGGVESRSLELPRARILALSRAGDMALLLNPGLGTGTLARAPLSGGVPREILDEVSEADWTADGSALVVVKSVRSGDVVEFPIGRPLYTGIGISGLRVSHDGERLAFFSTGDLIVLSRSGEQRTLSRGWRGSWNAVWSPNDNEIWFSGTRGDQAPTLFAVSLSGRERPLFAAPSPLILQDVTRDGRVLISTLAIRGGLACRAPGETEERELGWLDSSFLEDLSADGKWVLFAENRHGGGSTSATYLRATDGSPPVRLSDGHGEALSPDGTWALAFVRNEAVLLPTRAGMPRKLPRGTLTLLDEADWLPDGRRIVISGRDSKGSSRVYVQDVETGSLRAISPEGFALTQNAALPDGRHVLAWAGKWYFVPVDTGEPHAIPFLDTDESPIHASIDGRFLYVRRGTRAPARIERLELSTGRRMLWKIVTPRDPVGVDQLWPIVIAPSEAAYCYFYNRNLSDLFVVRGLR